ncbi:MAG: J domain-containing protein [Clostridia bacterium]|nr:J domain-containing protein [Clostridia bacterium]
MTDYYKILNLTFGASDTEIKKQYRKLASIYHPDKNGGSKKSEETFKIIVNAYQTLSDKQSRAVYDLKYKQYFQQPNPPQSNQNRTNSERKHSKNSSPEPQKHRENQQIRSNTKYNFLWIILLILSLLYFFYSNKSIMTGNSKADEQLEQQNTQERPESGEIYF